MRISLFNALYCFITYEIPKGSISKDAFLFYIIGAYSKCSKNEINYDIISNKESSALIKGNLMLHSIFPDKYYHILKKSKQLQLTNLENIFPSIKSSIKQWIKSKDRIIKIYKDHSISVPNNSDPQKLIVNLFMLCLVEEVNIFASYKNQQLKPVTLNSIVGRKDDSIRLSEKLKQYHKIIISDQYGTGKTFFIKYCLSCWKIRDYCYISYKGDLNITLEEIKYSDIFNKDYFYSIDSDIIKQTSATSLLIIDHMYHSKDFQKELRELAKLPINVIIISTEKTNLTFFYDFKISPLSNMDLKKMFENYSNFSFENEILWKELFYVTQKNTLMISLIANQCKKMHTKSDESICIEKNLKQICSSLIELENFKDPILYTKYKHSYDSKTLDIIGHTKNICNNIFAKGDKRLHEFMEILCCFGGSPIPLDFLCSILEKDTLIKLNKLSEFGLLTLSEESVQLIPLICHAVIYSKKQIPEYYENIIDKLINFLENYEQSLCIPYLSDILYAFILVLYPNVKTQNNSGQLNTSKIFEKWQKFLYLAIYYYNQNGNISIAKKIVSTIKYPDLKSFYNSTDISFFRLINNAQSEYDNEKIQSLLHDVTDSLIKRIFTESKGKSISEKISELKNNRFSDFIFSLPYITQSNNLIGIYCYYWIDILSGKTDNCNYLKKIPDAMKETFNPPKFILQNNISLSKDQLKYFRKCSFIMEKFPASHEYYEKKFSYFNNFSNMNLRICGMAFTIIMHALFIYCEPLFHSDFNDRKISWIKISFRQYISPEFEDLKKQVHNCKLLPRDTARLCIYAYILYGIIHFVYSHAVSEDVKPYISSLPDPDFLKELFDLSFFLNEEKTAIMAKINEISSSETIST